MTYITGFHSIQETVRAGASGSRIFIAGNGAKLGPRIREILELARVKNVPVSSIDSNALRKMAPDNRGIVLEIASSGAAGGLGVLGAGVLSTGVSAQSKAFSGATAHGATEPAHLEDFLATPRDNGLVLILDHIEDPQNFGAILRSADAFSADLVIAPTKRASPLSDAAMRASAGAAAWVPLCFVGNLGDALRRLKKAGFWAYAADMSGEAVDKTDLPAKCALILGNEGAGVSRLLRDLSDGSFSIPMSGHVDSLNVSAAAAILLYEYRRQKPL